MRPSISNIREMLFATTLSLRPAVSCYRRFMIITGLSAMLASPASMHAQSDPEPSATYKILMQDILINADLWSTEGKILSAGYGFEGIIGVDGNKEAVIAAGGAWMDLAGYDNPPLRAQTTALPSDQVAVTYGFPVEFADAIPVVFSWPVLPSTVSAEAFRVVLNTGEYVSPKVVSISPNLEYNERNTVVIFGEFGNRIPPGGEGAVYPVRVEIVETSNPMQLVGPQGPVSAVGLSKESSNPYLPNGGPTLVGAKLSVMSTEGEGAPAIFSSALPNDGIALYGEAAEYRLRILTTGGFSPNGISSVLPTDFETFFRLRLVDKNEDNEDVIIWLTEVNVPYATSKGIITILGLADLGPLMESYDLTYQEDHDNQIDIILNGDEAAMRLLTHIEIPGSDGYAPFYNPGGPGDEPTPGVTYTQPGPYTLQEITMAIDDPYTVTYMVPEPSAGVLSALGIVIFGAMLKGVRKRRVN